MREFWPRGARGILWTNLFGRRVTTGCTDERAARRWKQAQERDGADARFAAAKVARLDDATSDLIGELKRRGRALGTLRRAKEKLGHFGRLWGVGCRLATIDARKVAEYIDVRLTEPGARRGQRVQRITVRDELAFLRQLLKLARRNGLYARAVEDVLPIHFETGHKPRKDYVPFDSLPALLAKLPSHRKAHVLYFTVCGGRSADSFRARREDFDTKRWRIRVRGSKTEGSERVIPVPRFLRPLVRSLLKLAPGPDLLFLPWSDGSMNRDIKAACVRAGLSPVSTNGLRRTFGHALAEHGVSLELISKLFGHTTLKLARDVYADPTVDELAKALDAADRYRFGTTSHTRPKKPR